MLFSERMGFKKPKGIQLDALDRETRASLWNVCRDWAFGYENDLMADDYLRHFADNLYRGYYKKPIDSIPFFCSDFVSEHLEFFQNARWFDVFDIIDFISHNLGGIDANKTNFDSAINFVLESEKSAYRFVGGIIVPLSNETEIGEINAALDTQGSKGTVAAHIASALECFGRKPNPDYRNSIKESISAVEAAANIVVGKRATLGEALKSIDMHEAFKQSMLKLYGYTSDQGGIRHALSEASTIDEADARYMLVTCSACANFLLSKQ